MEDERKHQTSILTIKTSKSLQRKSEQYSAVNQWCSVISWHASEHHGRSAVQWSTYRYVGGSSPFRCIIPGGNVTCGWVSASLREAPWLAGQMRQVLRPCEVCGCVGACSRFYLYRCEVKGVEMRFRCWKRYKMWVTAATGHRKRKLETLMIHFHVGGLVGLCGFVCGI